MVIRDEAREETKAHNQGTFSELFPPKTKQTSAQPGAVPHRQREGAPPFPEAGPDEEEACLETDAKLFLSFFSPLRACR